MKKAKVVLTATALVAIVGGALAFTAHKSNPNIWQCNTSDKCVMTDLNLTQNAGEGTFTIPDDTYYKTGAEGACSGNCEEPITKNTVVFINP